MSDVLAQVDVLAKDSGCLVDITAVMDQGLCSKVMVKTDVPYETEDHPDYVSIIPTKVRTAKLRRIVLLLTLALV